MNAPFKLSTRKLEANFETRTTTDTAFGRFVAQLINLIDNLQLPAIIFQREFAVAKQLLETLPLTTAEKELANDRLLNSQRYMMSHEPGAAKYELHTLISSFESMIRCH